MRQKNVITTRFFSNFASLFLRRCGLLFERVFLTITELRSMLLTFVSVDKTQSVAIYLKLFYRHFHLVLLMFFDILQNKI